MQAALRPIDCCGFWRSRRAARIPEQPWRCSTTDRRWPMGPSWRRHGLRRRRRGFSSRRRAEQGFFESTHFEEHLARHEQPRSMRRPAICCVQLRRPRSSRARRACCCPRGVPGRVLTFLYGPIRRRLCVYFAHSSCQRNVQGYMLHFGLYALDARDRLGP